MPYEKASCNILLVEDNKLDIDLIERALDKLETGVRLTVAEDGEKALAYLKDWEAGSPTPILVLLDLNLPGIGGLEVLRVLKSHPRYKVLPVVVLTSSGEAGSIEQAYRLGVNSYIIKAINYDQFAKSITLIQRYWCSLNVRPE